MILPTITDSYSPIESYFQALEKAHGNLPPIPVSIKPIDVYLLQQIIAFYTVPPIIVDLASLPTGGASLAIWSKCSVEAVLPAYLTSQLGETGLSEYHSILTLIRKMYDYFLLESPSVPLDDEKVWQETAGLFQQKIPIIVAVAYAHSHHTNILKELSALLRLIPSAVLVMLPMGRVNTPAALAAVQLCSVKADRDLFLMPEINFAMHSSELGFVYPRAELNLLSAVERIRQLFTGNFDFLALLEMNFSLQQAYRKLEKQIEIEKQVAQDSLLAAKGWEREQYEGVVGYIRGAYHALVPLRMRLLLRNIRRGIIGVLRRIYHLLVPLRIRLKIRDTRVALIGR